MITTTPLRYPGGKSLMSPFFKEIIKINSMHNVTYAEPYAGGAGAAINLLLNNEVNSILINDACIGVFSFWHFLINEPNNFLSLFNSTEVNLDQWSRQREIFKSALKPSLELGFATFFLTRTNRSGILRAGPMGGQDPEKQKKSINKIDCRYKKDVLIKKLEKIIEKRNQIKVSNYDAIDFLKTIDDKNTLVYLDPPYFKQGKALYLNYYKSKNHIDLANFLRETKNFKWILSYDNVVQIKELYSDFNLYCFNLNYSAQEVKKGSELLTHSKDLILPKSLVIKRKSSNIKIKAA